MACGNFTSSGSSARYIFGYTGRETDSTNQHYYRARYYKPEVGRFIAEDPLETVAHARFGLASSGKLLTAQTVAYLNQTNLYVYTANAPTIYRDPSGWDNPGCDGVPACLGLETKEVLDCCRKHDECYRKNGCDASSWAPTAALITAGGALAWPLPCVRCNVEVMGCVGGFFKPVKKAYDEPNWLARAKKRDPTPNWFPRFIRKRYYY